MPDIIIIGAGPAGLGAGFRLMELGFRDFLILEQNSFPGGLASSFKTSEEFIFDLGGHVFFTKNTYFREVAHSLLKEELHFHIRNASVYLKERIIPYPFQDNIAALPQNLQLQIATDFFKLARNKKTIPSTKSNFYNWQRDRFGKTLFDIFMYPYNKKVWACDLRKMGTYWMGDRVSTLRGEDILERIILGKQNKQWGPNAEFFFPHLGTGYLFEKMALGLRHNIHFKSRVNSIDLKSKTLTTVDNKKFDYKYLITSMPVNTFLNRLVANFPLKKKFDQCASALRFNSGYIVGLGIDFPLETDKHWIYFPEKEFPWFRMTVISNYSPAMAPSGTSALMFDTSFNPYRGIDLNAKDIIPLLKKITFLPFIDERNVVSVFEKRLPYFYPIPTLDRDKYLSPVLKLLEKRSIYSIGRFGKWKYEEGNMDHAFIHGKEAAEQILNLQG